MYTQIAYLENEVRFKYEPQRQNTYVWHLCPAKIQISLRIRAVWSESSLGGFWIDKDAKFHHVDNEDLFALHPCTYWRAPTFQTL